MPVSATGGGGGRAADFDTISEAFPPDGSGGVPFALLLGLLSSLAINRGGIEQLLARVERSGSDPLLAIDRLVADSSIDPAVDLERRRHQLETFL